MNIQTNDFSRKVGLIVILTIIFVGLKVANPLNKFIEWMRGLLSRPSFDSRDHLPQLIAEDAFPWPVVWIANSIIVDRFIIMNEVSALRREGKYYGQRITSYTSVSKRTGIDLFYEIIAYDEAVEVVITGNDGQMKAAVEEALRTVGSRDVVSVI